MYSAAYPFLPVFSSQLSLLDTSAWQTAGYQDNDTRAFISAAQQTINHPFMMHDLRFPGQVPVKVILDDIARLAEQLPSPDGMSEIMNNATASIEQAVASFWGGKQLLKAMLWNATGYTPPVVTPVLILTADNAEGLSAGGIAGIAIGAVVVVACLLAAVAIYMHRLASQHRTLLGKLVPADVGPDTTLVYQTQCAACCTVQLT
jgi:hypothetical protein